MARLTAADFHPDLIELYDFYAHGRITKREFLDRGGRHTVGGMTALASLILMSPNYALALQAGRTAAARSSVCVKSREIPAVARYHSESRVRA